jgi:hypothetical protein
VLVFMAKNFPAFFGFDFTAPDINGATNGA